MMIDTEQYSFQLILHSGNARSTAYEALQLVKSNAFKEGEKKLSIAKEEMVEAQSSMRSCCASWLIRKVSWI